MSENRDGIINWMNEQNKNWAEQHFANMPMNGVWAGGLGFVMMKKSDSQISLVCAIDDPIVRTNLAGLQVLLYDLGYSYEDLDASWSDPPQSEEEMREFERVTEQLVINSWKCECGYPMMEIDVSDCFARYIETEEVLLDSGDTEEVEIWTYPLICTCGRRLDVNPDDFIRMHGQAKMHTHDTPDGDVIQAYTRYEICNCTDEEREKLFVVGDYWPDESNKLPPWMRGLVCGIADGDEEE
jgi:hypothetical protein